eukprot:jgi/Botrbrau1/6943/Bobra.0215s0020.1
MVYILSWADFAEQAEELVRSNVLDARFHLKYLKGGDAKCVLKVTDNRTVLQFKTDQQADVKKIVDLVAKLFPFFSSGKDAVEIPPSEAAANPLAGAAHAKGPGKGGKTKRTKS